VGEIEYSTENTSKGNIVTRVFIGSISKSEIVESFEYLVKNNLLTDQSCGMITDISNSKLDIDLSDLERITDFIKNNKTLSKVKIAVVAESPEKVLFTTLANFKVGDSLMPFSSIEAAKEWMLSE